VPLQLLPKEINGVRIVGIDVPGFGVPTHAEAKDVLAGAMLRYARNEAEQGPVAAPILPIRDPRLAPCPPQPNPYNVVQPIQPWQLDPRLPFMSYTRMFDGADADLAAALRDYVELSGAVRSGGWEAYMHRSDDFIKFTTHLMISEMLALHGGEGRHRLVLKPRKFKYPLGVGNL
jgi:hypothetical protein